MVTRFTVMAPGEIGIALMCFGEMHPIPSGAMMLGCMDTESY